MGKRVTFAAVVLALAVAGISFAAKSGGSKDVTLCAAKKDGALSLASKGKCGKGQRKLVIAKEGPAGPIGPQGAAGPAGNTASIQPEAVHPVAPRSTSEAFDCAPSTGTFCNNHLMHWANFGGGSAAAGFQKDAAGYVHLQGTVKSDENPGVSGGSFELQIFRLPDGYRPSGGIRRFAVPCGFSVPVEMFPLEVGPDGVVRLSEQICDFGRPLSLDGVSFHP